MTDSHAQQPRIFEIRVYITPARYDPDTGTIDPEVLAVTTAEIINGQGVGFGPVVRAVTPTTSGMMTSLLKAMGATMGSRISRYLREGVIDGERAVGVSGGDATQLGEAP
jgi:hypothetical protein